MDKKLITIGKIIAPHGVRGEFRIMPLTEEPNRYLTFKKLTLEDGRELTLLQARLHKNIVLVKTKEINSMDEAELLRGKKIVVKKEDLPPLEEGRYYVSDLIGFRVEELDGTEVGALSDVITTGPNDVFVVKPKEGADILIPAIDSFIKKIAVTEKLIQVVLPKWAD